ncbi:3-oxoacyl-[acyl-carrier-protein] synthase 2 [Actinomadura sp. NBRC 104412]|uniref:beta-ketoacyl-[acyl-carrier-protein] synthase family protein n=1 Tax=Actinomadura sp. NBRC 104412 TaxID=3032203 RepID=UPI0024A1FE86|nr:beta-ketoacyl-[acyl-carrier-protein] synthase family protein [Actinomadura sp. NBRC 104412]GLZ04855.1 3-oxoacyl-[acyl-carrier-protein] synthase 2 [Actinomadura sp. NBRC 104412]
MFPEHADGRGRPRVAITGMGVITPAGETLDAFYANVHRGLGLAGPVTRFDADGLPTRIACEVHGFDATDYLPPKDVRRLDPFARFAVAAALRAVEDAGAPRGDPYRRGVVCGTALGGHHIVAEQALACARKGPLRVSGFLAPMGMDNSPAAAISARLGWLGPALTVNTACAAGATAIGEAVRWIRSGDCDTVLAGGTDAGVNRLMMAAFSRLRALSRRNDEPERASRPFDKARDGYVMGEGAAFLVLERLDVAARWGARVYAEVAGYGHTSDAYHPTAPLPDGTQAARCMRLALADAGLDPSDIGHLNAHGTGTRLNDAMEATALTAVFGQAPPPVTAPKGVLGHLMGAAGAAEAVVAALSARDGLVPPVANHEDGDPEHPLDIVTVASRRVRPGAAVLSNSFGFGGHNAGLVIAPHRLEVAGP